MWTIYYGFNVLWLFNMLEYIYLVAILIVAECVGVLLVALYSRVGSSSR